METILLWPEGCAPYENECGGQAAPSITPYVVEGSRGAVVVCPGGGYTFKAPHEGGPIAEMINAAGISAFVLDYRVKPCPHDAPLGDAKRAIRTVRAMGYEKVAILGFSAGGNLACTAATLYDAGDAASEDPIERLSSRPDGLISCYSVASMIQHTHMGTVVSLLGDQYGSVPLKRHYSAEWNVTPDTPPAFIWHTAEDASVPVENSLNLAAAMSKCGVPFELHVFPQGRHGLGLAEEIPATAQWTGLCQKWLIEQGYAK
ncbi:MAG: alpha/beta hydrolase [Butyricicoccus sp.]|nr:alpha/beta hydrolase [Butyricicoccus sp.]